MRDIQEGLSLPASVWSSDAEGLRGPGVGSDGRMKLGPPVAIRGQQPHLSTSLLTASSAASCPLASAIRRW